MQGSALMVYCCEPVLGNCEESVAVTVNVELPWVVGVPLMVPLPASSDSPGGRLPAVTEYRYGPVPPEEVIVSS